MKLDKETVVKHQFWFLLGGFLLLWLIGLISLKVAAAGPIAKKKADFTSALQGVKGWTAPGKAKNENFWKPWEDYGAKYDGYKKDAWQKAWTLQQYVETWPEPLDRKMFYPQDPMDDGERGNYQQNWYANQFKSPVPLEEIAFPVQYAGGFDAVFPKQKWTDAKLPTREEIWLAQEDVWVRREMLYILREAMDSVARFEEVKVDEKKEAAVPEGHQRRRFRNYYFEIDLVIGPGKSSKRPVITTLSTIKNISKDNRVLPLANPRTTKGIPFYLYQGASGWALFRLEGEPLAPQAEKPTPFTKAYPVTGVDLRKPFALVQGFEWENCPIRALEEITLAKNCSRLEKVPLKARDILKALDAPPEAKEGEKPEGEGGGQPGGTPGGAPGGMPGGAPGGMPGPPGGMPGGPPGGMRSPGPPGQGSNQMGQGGTGAKGGAHVPDPTPVNKIDRKRYLHVTPQCRQLPIKLRLIIEQPHIQNVLAAIANNRLRIQITQVEVEHVGSVKATGISDFVPGEQSTTGRMPPGMPPGMPPKGSGAGFRGSGGGPPAGMPTSPPPPGMAPPGGSGAGPMSPTPPGVGATGGMPKRMPPMTGTGTPTTTSAKPTNVKDPNMVELTVYGIAALYERFPPKAPPAPPAEGGTNP